MSYVEFFIIHKKATERYKKISRASQPGPFASQCFDKLERLREKCLHQIKSDVSEICKPISIASAWEFGEYIGEWFLPNAFNLMTPNLDLGATKRLLDSDRTATAEDICRAYLGEAFMNQQVKPSAMKTFRLDSKPSEFEQFAFFISFYVNLFFNQ